MIERNDEKLVVVVLYCSSVTVIARDNEFRNKCCPTMTTKRNDNFRLDNFYLLHQIWPKLTFFLWQWVAVVRRTVLHDVRNVYICASETSSDQHLVQKF